MTAPANKPSVRDHNDFWNICVGGGSTGITFWGYLIIGSLLWFMLFSVVGYCFGGSTGKGSMAAGGLILLLIGLCWFVWGFIFCFASLRSAFRHYNRPVQVLTVIAVLLYILVLLGVAAYFIHLVIYAP